MGAGLVATMPAFAASTGQTMTMEATAYGPSLQDNYPYGPTDYFGQPLTAGDIAVDPTVIPLRTCLYVTGYSSPNLPTGGFIGEADDEGGAIKGMHVDLYMNASPSKVSNFGIQTVKVTVLGPARSTSLSGTAACAGYAAALSGSGSQGSGSNQGAVSPQSQASGKASGGQTSGQGQTAGQSSGAAGKDSGLVEGSSAPRYHRSFAFRRSERFAWWNHRRWHWDRDWR